MAYIVRRPGDEVFILQNQAQPFPPIDIGQSAFFSADIGAFPPENKFVQQLERGRNSVYIGR